MPAVSAIVEAAVVPGNAPAGDGVIDWAQRHRRQRQGLPGRRFATALSDRQCSAAVINVDGWLNLPPFAMTPATRRELLQAGPALDELFSGWFCP